MASSLGKFFQKIFGSKQDRDVAKYEPVVEEINRIYVTLTTLSNDELRARTPMLRKRINDYLSEIDAEVTKLNEQVAGENDFRQKRRYL